VEDHQGAVAVSALRNEGLEIMMRRLADRMRAITQVTELMVPYDRGDILASIHREGEVVMSELEDGGMRIRARLSSASEGRLREFVVPLTNQRN
jgi:GTP-binding protein HflX